MPANSARPTSSNTTTAPPTDPVNVLTGPLPVGERKTLDRKKRKVLLAGSIGQFIEFYDFSLYGLSALTLSKLFFPGDNAIAALLATFATFGVAFFIRPLGGLFFGALGDRYGRRPVLYVTLLTIGIATTVIGLLPTYAQIGAFAPILLVACRLLQGFSAGGESVGAPAFVFEHAPKHQRGRWLNITLAATALPSVVGSTLILWLSSTLATDDFDSWGWRIPFLLALPLALFGLWIRTQTEESEAFKQVVANRGREEHTPIRDAFRENWFQMLQVIMVMGLTAMGFYFLTGYFVAYVQTASDLSRDQSLMINAAAMLLYTIVLPLMGHFGDKLGRRTMLIWGAVAIALFAIPAFMLVTSGNLGVALIGQLIFVICICVYGGGCYTFFVEVFSTRTRFTSAAVSYNVGYAVFGGTAPFIGTWLVDSTGWAVSPGVYVTVMAVVVLIVILATKVPETHPIIKHEGRNRKVTK